VYLNTRVQEERDKNMRVSLLNLTRLLGVLVLSSHAFAQSSKAVRLVPLKARVETTSGNAVTVSTYVRDAQGRSRLDAGHFVTINDPIAGEGFQVDMRGRTARRYLIPRQGSRRFAGHKPGGGIGLDLGLLIIEGCEARGVEHKLTLPVSAGSSAPKQVQQIVQVWSCKELALPLLVETRDEFNGLMRYRYFEIQKPFYPDPDVFRVPAGFNVTGDLTVSTQ
jgi:hypothetical protein